MVRTAFIAALLTTAAAPALAQVPYSGPRWEPRHEAPRRHPLPRPEVVAEARAEAYAGPEGGYARGDAYARDGYGRVVRDRDYDGYGAYGRLHGGYVSDAYRFYGRRYAYQDRIGGTGGAYAQAEAYAGGAYARAEARVGGAPYPYAYGHEDGSGYGYGGPAYERYAEPPPYHGGAGRYDPPQPPYGYGYGYGWREGYAYDLRGEDWGGHRPGCDCPHHRRR
ncbi:hypothetical protein Q0812_11390 [Brevundimonas sp. 2R-24]|uniref:Uncharacterized protein n=1 Tax=Peiella sedimenti TaxID=3061083 RepID=A0ABT8SPI3_9CAUL|nr:hypothetical protein [Caulobacteraceae bacterium XZ-24]